MPEAKTDKASPVRCLINLLNAPITRFEMLSDSDSNQHRFKKARARRGILEKIAGKANADGTGSYVTDSYLISKTGFTKKYIITLRQELKLLGLLRWEDCRGFRGDDNWGSNKYTVSTDELWPRRHVIAKMKACGANDSGDLNGVLSDPNSEPKTDLNGVLRTPEWCTGEDLNGVPGFLNGVPEFQKNAATASEQSTNAMHRPFLPPSIPTALQPPSPKPEGKEGGQDALALAGQEKIKNVDLIESMAEIFGSKNLPDIKSGLGSTKVKAEIREREAKDGADIVRGAWTCLLENRSFKGLNNAIAAYWFLQEYPEWKNKAAAIIREASDKLKAKKEFADSQAAVKKWLAGLATAPNIDAYVEANPAPPQYPEEGSTAWTIPYADDAISTARRVQEKALAKYQEEMAGVPY